MRVAAALISAVFVVACGVSEPSHSTGGEPLFPVAVGNVWTFRVSSSKGEKQKTQTILDSVAAATYTFVSESDGERTLSIQVLDGARLNRISEESSADGVVKERVRFTPPSIRLDVEESTLGESYDAAFVEERLDEHDQVLSTHAKSQHFVVEAVDEEITVPAGHFRAVRIRRDTMDGPSKTYWYVRGVGKIREVGGQTEELADYHLENEAS